MPSDSDGAIRFVIVGGVAAGASAAARARRLSENASITILERGSEVSFANCGMPYYIGGEIEDRGRLAIHTPQSLAQTLNLDIRVRTEAVRIVRERKVVVAYDHNLKQEIEFPYDKLLLAPGARPIRPPLPGMDDDRVMTLRNLKDMDKIKERMGNARRVLIIGAGFIGLEMVEMMARLGKNVTLVELQQQVLPQMDPEMVKQIEVELIERGVELVLGDGIAEFQPAGNVITARLNSGKTIASDIVILCIGVECESKLAAEAGLELGQRKAIKVNEFQQTSDPDIYAAGDAVETSDFILGKRVVVPLAGPANRQGRVAADHIFLKEKARPYPGSIGTAIVRAFSVAAGVVGYTEKRLKQENIRYGTTMVTASQHAGYYPGAVPVVLKILWSPEDGRLLGGQAVGCDGVDKRIDVLSTAITGRLTIEDLCHLELAYSPPFGSARDVVNLAGFSAQNIQEGLVIPVYSLLEDTNVQVLDVRGWEAARLNPIEGAIHIPFGELRLALDELDREKPVVTVCALGKMSYFAARVLSQNGFQVRSLVGGIDIRRQKPSREMATTSTCKIGDQA